MRRWKDGEILTALRVDAKRRGRPPTDREWEKGRKSRPSSQTVKARFGWARAQFLAGLTPRPAHAPRRELCKKRLHPLVPENVVTVKGDRLCVACRRARGRKAWRRRAGRRRKQSTFDAYDRRKAAGLCVRCGGERDSEFVTCGRCRETMRKRWHNAYAPR
jgi:hypothetical protein